jgi:excisionase family DNA binding protein
MVNSETLFVMQRTLTTFVPIAEAADRLGFSVSWLRAEVEAGRIPAVRAGRRWFVHFERTKAELSKRAGVESDQPEGGQP